MAVTRNIVVRTLITYLIGFVVSVFFLCGILPLLLFPPSLRHKKSMFFVISSWWSRIIVWIAGIVVAVNAPENSFKKPAVVVMNHASALDIVLVEKIMGGMPRIWLGKNEYEKTPILNWILKRMHVLVDTQSPTHAARALRVVQTQATQNKAHVLLFPEGARYSDGKIHTFYKGFAVLAQQLKRPIIPVYIQGAHVAYAKNSFLIDSNQPLVIEVGQPFTAKAGQTSDELTAQVREWFVARSEHYQSVGKTSDLV